MSADRRTAQARGTSVLHTDADRLATEFTARELAEQLALRNAGFIRWRARAFRAEGVLRQIMAGMFTERGAREEARRVLEESHG